MFKVQCSKIIVYQVLPRLFGNRNTRRIPHGSLEENGCGKMNDFDVATLRRIKESGITHIWFTGVIRHATQTDYSAYGIPVQHPEVVKGKAGSPYAIADYYDIDPDLAVNVSERMKEFEALVERVHQAGMKVIIDFVPNHVAREYKSICKPEGVKDLGEGDDINMHFSIKNNFYYCWNQPLDLSDIELGTLNFELYDMQSENIDISEDKSVSEAKSNHKVQSSKLKVQRYTETPARATGNDQFSNRPSPNDWYETVKLNYGIDYCDAGGRSEHFNPIPNTWGKMTDILLFWAGKGIDGFRCDMAEMVPAAFWTWATDKVKFQYPDCLFIGEVYDPNQYRTYIGAGFDYLYDKVGMYDCIRDVICGRRRTTDITSQWQATDDIRDHMLYFLENHDEQRIASDFFAGKAEKGIPGLIVSALLQKNPFMLYAGQEYGERGMDEEGFSGKDGRTTIFDYWSVDTLTRAEQRKLTKEEKALKAMYDKVLNIARSEKSVAEGESFDLMYVNQQYQRQYAFLRKADSEVLLVVANFDEQSADMDVTIPAHAFDYLQIKEKNAIATDLLTGKKKRIVLRRDEAVSLQLPPLGAVVLKFKA
ncbi:MAG: alpha amylase C-terminal domain-containing protein [Prevotella sp.]|nr:alpha amylase C-terminal domain-containing protein [Prevotella sp.]